MNNREKVIKGLDCCTKFNNEYGDCTATDCPYMRSFRHCADLMCDAFALLKAQEPRVLTLDEVEDALDTVVWVDRPQIENSSDEYALISKYSHALGWGELKFVDGSTWHWMYKQYDKNLLCWNRRPTDEQREAVKWND